MIRTPKVTMTMRELDRLKCIQGLIDGQYKQHAVAARLGLTTRQVRRMVRRYEQHGPVGLISRLRDRPSTPILPHVILLSDASPGMLPAELDHLGSASSFELQDEAQSDAEGGRSRA
jgi:hypothetical protein